jgi:hypothetical protein
VPIGAKAMEAIGRNPEAMGDIRTNMILAIAFVDELVMALRGQRSTIDTAARSE